MKGISKTTTADFVCYLSETDRKSVTACVWMIPGTENGAQPAYSFDGTASTISAFHALRNHTVSQWIRDWV
jgi:hypothetical protein